MNQDLQKLIELEKVDREATRLTEEVAALPKRVAAIEEKLAEHKAAWKKPRPASKPTKQAAANWKPISKASRKKSPSTAASLQCKDQ